MEIEKGRIINDFIEPNKRQYLIPVYQRNYEWSRAECTKLFQDIVVANQQDKIHFCGSIVFQQIKEERGIYHFIIIDGQQRLTTIYLLLKALLDNAETDKERESLAEVLFNRDRYDDYEIDTANKLKLKPIKSDNKQLLLLMNGNMEQVDHSSGIWLNYALFDTLIKKEKTKDVSVKDIYRGIEKLICARIRLEDGDHAQEIFERINSTGVPLSLADKIRNYVLMTDSEQERLYEQYWLQLENLLPTDQLPAFFIDYLNFKQDGFVRIDDAYDSFKKIIENNGFSNEKMLAELLHYAKFYHEFVVGSQAYGEKIYQQLAGLRQLKQTTVFLFLFHLFDDMEQGTVNQEEAAKVIRFLLNYSIRRLVCEIGSNSLRGLYKTLYSRVFNRPENKKHYYDSVVSFFQQAASKDALLPDEEFQKALIEKNLYNKRVLCKYLLCAIENQGKEQLLTDNMTIEHILPQNKNLSTAWQRMLGENWQNDHDKYVSTLGNLTLTAYNSELGDLPFEEKKAKLEEKHTKVVLLYEDVKSCPIWNTQTIIKRAERLASLILEIFPILPPENQISFADPRLAEYTCDIPENATYKTPCYYILQGERINVSNYAEMLRSFLGRLYIQNPSIIEEMARHSEKLHYAQYALFSYDVTTTRNGKEIGDSGIIESSGFSAQHIMTIIQIMLDRYEIDRQDFVYCARSNEVTESVLN